MNTMYLSAALYVTILLTTELSFISKIYSFLIDMIATLLSLTSIILIYRYYGSLMEIQKTMITTLMRMLMVSSAVLVVAFPTMIYTTILLPDQVAAFYMYNPELACSTTTFVPFICFLTCLFFVLVVKTYMTAEPLEYLNLNHDRLSTIAIMIVVSQITSELVILLLVYGTLCQKFRIIEIEHLFNIELNMDVSSMPPILAIHAFSLLLPQIAYKIIKYKKKISKSRISPAPTVVEPNPIFILPPPINATNQELSISPIQSINPTSSAVIELSVVAESYVTNNISHIQSTNGPQQYNPVITPEKLLDFKTSLVVVICIVMAVLNLIYIKTGDSQYLKILIMKTIPVAIKISIMTVPHFWILRSEEISKYAKRKLKSAYDSFRY